MAFAATVVAVACLVVSAVLGAGASGHASRSARDAARIDARAVATTRLGDARRRTPVTTTQRCSATRAVVGQGPSCRTADGMYLIRRSAGAYALTHGPDLVDAAAPRRGRSGGFGTSTSVVCTAPSRTRHIVLTYLLPHDYASGAGDVHGDRFAEVAPQMRQSLFDASAMIDARAGELARGAHRRLRVQCDPDGTPTVERVVLPHTAAQYRAPIGGFSLIGEDLETLGLLPQYAAFSEAHLPTVRRVLGYYDADFNEGFAGQGTMFRRSTLLATSRLLRPSDPIVSRTARNINNNPPQASLAVQYGTSFAGVPDPPLYTSLLHELTHTMGAVQDEPPTSSDAGHCVDGLDIMCYDDGGPSGSYSATVCPDPTPPEEAPEDERFDCNGDTYFHPAPPAGNPLASPVTWQLGLLANETMDATSLPAPPAVASLAATGPGTSIVLRWPAVAPVRGRAYDVAVRPAGGSWASVATTTNTAVPSLRPGTVYELAVGAIGADGAVGPRAVTTRRTGRDTSPPSPPL
ncbi:MAG: hypothetical protein JWM98_2536, partial [Thermoleophilia bacterium]|nr:hypothetical protein [Thermoleophilia bacterium]